MLCHRNKVSTVKAFWRCRNCSRLQLRGNISFSFAEKVRLATRNIGSSGPGQALHITVSAGAVTLPLVHLDADSHTGASDAAAVIRKLLEEADRCLYQAKNEGRDRVVALSLNGIPQP